MCNSGLGHTLVSRILIPNKILTILQSYTNTAFSHYTGSVPLSNLLKLLIPKSVRPEVRGTTDFDGGA